MSSSSFVLDVAARARLLDIARRAGAAILEVYARDFEVEAKADRSPLTEADLAAHALIRDGLAALAPAIPLLSEESAPEELIERRSWQRYWLVDPLDGTREFVKRNGEFTVNIAFCIDGHPVRGVVLAPATGDIFWGGPEGAFAGRVLDGEIADTVHLKVQPDGPVRIVASRSHGHAALAQLCDTLQVAEDVSVGSSLKFCLMAKGDAQLYPRFTPTCEWDTAAGQAVLEAAGGSVRDWQGRPLLYGKPDFRNPGYLARGRD